MKNVRFVLFLGLIILYSSLFVFQEKKGMEREVSLSAAMPVKFYQIAAGYLRQFAAEMLFIRTSVFIGGVPPGTPEESYVDSLGNNFDVMTKLYPRFLDPYYFCQSFMPHVSIHAAKKASTILETGVSAYPEDITLRFFYATNFFLFMNEPFKGAAAFKEAAKLPKAPPMFGHLAALLSAQGGDITAGLVSLKAMLAVEKDEDVRIRYQQEIKIFEQALEVQKSLEQYTQKYGVAANTLEELVPEFIESIPDIQETFILDYNKPTLQLRRPDWKKK